MSTLFTIALRNLLRHKRRTVLTGIIISFGIWVYIFMDSVMSGMDRGSIDNMIDLTTSAVKIHTAAYDEEKESLPLKYGLGDVAGLSAAITTHDRVEGVAPRTQFIGELSNYEESIPVVGTVVDPEKDKTVFTLTDYLTGDYFGDAGGQEIILGKELARDLNVKPGDYITLYALTRHETRNADDFKITGVFNTTDPNLNKSGVFISYRAADRFLDLDNMVTELNVRLKHRINFSDLEKDMESVRAMVRKKYPDLATYTFAELGAGVLELVRQKKAWGAGMLLVLLLIAGVGIVNSVLMSVYERIREVGVMRAMGYNGGDIMKMFMFEGVMIGFTGSLGGVILGIASVIFLTTVGYPLEKLYGDMSVDTAGFPIWGTIYGEWNWWVITGTFLFGLITAFVASIPPARKAARMEVTAAIRFT